jgi:aspartyl-tRNA(Asn)/glutamyl-tRNA(Gln) amidotransferase subunit A
MGSSLDCPGPICKSVEDCAILLDILAGKDPKDATSYPSKKGDYFDNLEDNIQGLKIGLPTAYFESKDIQEDVVAKVQDALSILKKAGAELVDIELMDPKYAIAVYTLICRSEVSSNLARYDGIRYGHSLETSVETINEFIAKNRGGGFGEESQRRIMTGTYALSSGYYDAYYKKAQKVRTMIKQDLDQAFEKVDVIIGPTTPSTALEVGATEDNPLFGEIADVLIEAGTLSGCPGLNVPVGFDQNDMPVGMNIIAPQFEEQIILNLVYAYQRQTDWHTKFPKL